MGDTGRKRFPSIVPPPLPESFTNRVLPREIATGTLRGQQNVGGGRVIIDSDNQRITIEAADGSKVGIGIIPDGSGELGFFSFNTDDELVLKIRLGTMYMYDGPTGVNRMQVGKIPDDTYNVVISKEGEDVEDAF